jgi:uncharacterized protein (UPF0332 family)
MTEGNRHANSLMELKRARDSLASAELLMKAGMFDDAVTRMYYAAFHHASAALLILGVQVESHQGLRTMVALHLVKPGLVPVETSMLLTALFDHRNQADYDRTVNMDAAAAEEDWQALLRLVESFDAALRAAGFATLKG